MNRALAYLWFVLLRRKTLHFIRGLRRPTTLIGFAALAFCLSFWFYHRNNEIFAHLVRREMLIGGALVMLCGSVFMGFLQRGLVFEPPDVEFLFTSPFGQRQIIFYRLLPNYLFALVQGFVFLLLLGPHLKHPALSAAGLTFFQIVCFHVAAGAAIFAGTISEPTHHRLRWMMLGVCFIITALYLRAAWDVKLVPSLVSASLAQILFYPALTLSDIGTAPVVGEWALRLLRYSASGTEEIWLAAIYPGLFAIAAAVSLGLLLRLKANIFEASLATTTRAAERRLRLRQGRNAAVVEEIQLRSVTLPQASVFRGVGAIIWKNLMMACRSRRALMLAAAFTLIYTGFLVALRWTLHRSMTQGAQLPAREVREFDTVLVGLLCFLAFLLQRTFSFDFRRDGNHLVTFRTLPVPAFALALAELAVPVALCVAFQALGIIALMAFARLEWLMMMIMLLTFPAVALALNGVWNLHYLLAATRRAGGKAESTSPVGILMVVALSFLVFYPAGWTAVWVGRHTFGRFSEALAFGAGLAVQYFIDFLLVLTLANLFQRFEVSRDS
jgi:hypothetical protein